MTNHEEVVGDAAAALSERGWGIREASQHVAFVPGLYAIHAAPVTWKELGLVNRPEPLYAARAELSCFGMVRLTRNFPLPLGWLSMRRVRGPI